MSIKYAIMRKIELVVLQNNNNNMHFVPKRILSNTRPFGLAKFGNNTLVHMQTPQNEDTAAVGSPSPNKNTQNLTSLTKRAASQCHHSATSNLDLSLQQQQEGYMYRLHPVLGSVVCRWNV
mmetsp:Transcript_37058/g.49142  ORF Transcript_37058/g.49142 Transcript_37058/m.49142 type:complete len:121 (-) Transcript_37058:1271-1633(-)